MQTSKQKQTNRERYGYRFVSGSRDIFQLWSTHVSVQLVYLIYKYSIFNIYTAKSHHKESNAEVCQYFPAIQLREGVSSSKFVFTPTFIFCSPICLNNCGAVFFCENIFQFSRNDFSLSIAKICKFSPWMLPELCDLVSWIYEWLVYER